MNALPRRDDESWIGVYQKYLRLFHLPLQFDKLAGDCFNYVDSSDKTKICSNRLDRLISNCAAICSNIMRAGKHTVSFQINDADPSRNSGGIRCGIMRPTTKDITSLTSCHPAHDDLSRYSLKDYESLHSNNNVDSCVLVTYMGNGLIRKRWSESYESFHWEGMEETQTTSFKIGFVLDLDEGTLDVYKNDRRLGTMKSGLVGEYCWVASLMPFGPQVSVTISRC